MTHDPQLPELISELLTRCVRPLSMTKKPLAAPWLKRSTKATKSTSLTPGIHEGMAASCGRTWALKSRRTAYMPGRARGPGVQS